MAEKNKKPEIRFKGFVGEWEERKLKDVSTYSNGGSFENDVQEKGRYELVTLKSVDMDGNLVHSERYVDIEAHTLTKGTLVMILSEQSPGLLGMTAQIPIDNTYILNQRVAEIRPIQNIDSYFLSMAINKNQQYFSRRGAGTKVQNISKPNVENYEFLCPLIQEQYKIGTYFNNLDHLITINQHKYDKLVTVKKAMLEKMFPQNGAVVPEIRFKGFTEAWEEKRLGDVGEFKSNGVDKRITSKEIPVNLLNFMDVYNFRRLNSKNCYELMQVTAKPNQLIDNNILENDVFFTPSSETLEDIGKIMVIAETLPDTVYSYHLMRFRPTKNVFYSIFPNYGFACEFVRKQLVLSAQGVQRFVISKPSFEKVTVLIPSIKEQTKIGNFFKNLDNLITLQKRELEKLKNIKKACLEKMFV